MALTNPDPDDRMKLKFIKYETRELINGSTTWLSLHIYAQKVLHYKKEINSKNRDSAEDRGRTYEADDNPERLFTHNGEEFYITSIEESEDEVMKKKV